MKKTQLSVKQTAISDAPHQKMEIQIPRADPLLARSINKMFFSIQFDWSHKVDGYGHGSLTNYHAATRSTVTTGACNIYTRDVHFLTAPASHFVGIIVFKTWKKTRTRVVEFVSTLFSAFEKTDVFLIDKS
jgi:hypothetical protein